DLFCRGACHAKYDGSTGTAYAPQTKGIGDKRRYVVQRYKRQLLSEFDIDRERKERQLLDIGCGICLSAFRLQGCTDTARNLYGRGGLQSSAIGRCKKDHHAACRANSRCRL